MGKLIKKNIKKPNKIIIIIYEMLGKVRRVLKKILK